MSYPQQPPPPPGYGYAPNHPRATTSLVLGILSLVVCGILGPFAWVIGGNTVKEIDASGGTLGGRGSAQAGKICGIVATALLVVVVIGFILLVVLGLAIGSVNTSTTNG
jgi:hypothetical protein